jgi:cation diffusion facilitator family transporter
MIDTNTTRGIRAAQAGLVTNITLVLVKLLAGIFGNTYALIADAVESSTDIFSSLIVWGGLSVAATPPDKEHPFGHGKAEAIAGATVSLMLILAAVGIAVAAVREIITPHEMPAPWTLAVAGGVILVKEILFRRVFKVGSETGSGAVQADAWHHRSDAISSAAAFIGIAIALWGGPGWESADDWAALVASAVVGFNGLRLLRPAIHDLMDRMPEGPVVEKVAEAAQSVEGVRAIEKLRVRKLGMGYSVDIHVQADPAMPLRDAHSLGGRVKAAIRAALPAVFDVTIHMEPFESS